MFVTKIQEGIFTELLKQNNNKLYGNIFLHLTIIRENLKKKKLCVSPFRRIKSKNFIIKLKTNTQEKSFPYTSADK